MSQQTQTKHNPKYKQNKHPQNHIQKNVQANIKQNTLIKTPKPKNSHHTNQQQIAKLKFHKPNYQHNLKSQTQQTQNQHKHTIKQATAH